MRQFLLMACFAAQVFDVQRPPPPMDILQMIPPCAYWTPSYPTVVVWMCSEEESAVFQNSNEGVPRAPRQ